MCCTALSGDCSCELFCQTRHAETRDLCQMQTFCRFRSSRLLGTPPPTAAPQGTKLSHVHARAVASGLPPATFVEVRRVTASIACRTGLYETGPVNIYINFARVRMYVLGGGGWGDVSVNEIIIIIISRRRIAIL